MAAICVFCGANNGIRPEYSEAAATLAEELVRQGHTLVYGGGNIGLMGIIADQALALGGEVVGVLPQELIEKEIAHNGLTRLHIVDNMFARKQLLTELSDGFITLPGGTGTLDELFEELVLKQIGFHRKPLALLNTCGYYRQLLTFLHHARDEGYITPQRLETLVVEEDPRDLLQKLTAEILTT